MTNPNQPQQYRQPQYMQPYTPKKKGGALKWVLIVIAAVLVIGAIGAATGGSKTAAPTATVAAAATTGTKTQATPQKFDRPGVNSPWSGFTYTGSKISFSITNVSDQATLRTVLGDKKPSAGKWLVVEMDLKNVSNATIGAFTLTPKQFVVRDAGGLEYESAADSGKLSMNNGGDFSEAIQPKQGGRYAVVFDVASDIKDPVLYFRNDIVFDQFKPTVNLALKN